jgi:hypothetical protein
MKTIQILAIVLLSSLAQAVRAQKIIESQAFDKMIRNDIAYAISGGSTPITGIKLDISKPEGTLSGMFPIKDKKLLFDLVSFEFKGGVTDKSFSLLKGNFVANSAFEFKPSFHFFFWGSAPYGKGSENKDKVAIVKVKNIQSKAELDRVLDTAYVVTLLYNHHLTVFDKPKPVPGDVTG